MAYPIIAIITYILVAFVRKTSVKNEWLPLIACATGGCLALLGFYIAPTVIAATTWYTAVVGGALSGLAATGGNQVFKQAIKLVCEEHGVDYNKVEPIADKVDKALKDTEKAE